jgi:menaquinone-dependent protoporphyrinogen oxidase
MAGTLVIYRTKYGSTKQYAEWLAEAVSADMVPAAKADPAKLSSYDNIVFGSYVRVGKMVGADFLIKNWKRMEGRNVFIFIVSGTHAGEPESDAMLEASLPPEIRKKAKVFRLMGRLGKLDVFDKMLMLFPATIAWIRYRRTKGEKEKKELERLRHFDEVDRKAVVPIAREIAARGRKK